ncbi:hypothetical protein G9A89_005798 [Geosiphon pyriformis]|nr:hypothetical protein G9A89_005798 [Geosiphon pyriformis]
MSKKKAPKGAFHGPAGGSFLQKKKVVLENVKHSDDKKNISLSKSELGNNMFSDVDNVFGDKKSANMTGINVGSLLDSAANTLKAKHINTDTIFSSSLGFPNFVMDNDEDVFLFLCLSIFLEKKWIDPKIIKTQVEVSAKKFFALDINLSAIEGKSATAKTHMNMAISLAREKEINVNSDLKRQEMRSDQAVIIKKIPINTFKNMIVTTTMVEFAELNQADSLASKWSFLIGKDSVCVAKAVRDCETWAFRDWFRALLFTLSVGTTVHDLGNLLKSAGGKTCIIIRSMKTGNRIYCAVVGFVSDNNLESAFYMEPIFNEIRLSWARMDLVHCEKCGHFGHLALKCNTPDAIMLSSSKGSYKKSASEELHFQLAKLYEKKCVLISHPAAFGSKFWTQVVSLSKSSDSTYFGSGSSLFLHGLSSLGGIFPLVSTVFSGLSNCLVVLKRSLELLADQVFDIMKKLSFVELVPLASKSFVSLLVVPAFLDSVVDSDMALNGILVSSILSPLVVADTVANLSSSSSKILTTKVVSFGKVGSIVFWFGFASSYKLLMSDLVWKFATYNVKSLNNLAKQEDTIRWHKDFCNSVSIFIETKLKGCTGPWIKNRFSGLKVFSFGMDSEHCGAEIAIILNDDLAYHMCKISEVPGCLIFVRFLFASKAFVMILGLYAGASAGVRFKQASAVNALIALTISSSSYILLSGDFNKNGAGHSISFKKCSDLGLHNVLLAGSISKSSMWYNFRGVKKTIDFIFVSNHLSSAVFDGCIGGVFDHFDTDHLAVLISVGLGGLLDKQLNTLHKLANTDCWKFDFKDSDAAKWKCFDDHATAGMLFLRDDFAAAKDFGDLNAITFDCSRNKHLSRFYRLELLIVKIVKTLNVGNSLKFVRFVKIWSVLDDVKFSKISGLLDTYSNSVEVFKQLSVVKKHYYKTKYIESELAKSASINRAIGKCMNDFVLEKSNMISSILKHPFHKIVLDHLVLNGELILKLAEVKAKKHKVLDSVSDLWSCQYASLDYIVDNAFSGVINEIWLGDLCAVVKNLPDGKAAGLSDVSNELWKHCDNLVLSCLLNLLNSCLMHRDVLAL